MSSGRCSVCPGQEFRLVSGVYAESTQSLLWRFARTQLGMTELSLRDVYSDSLTDSAAVTYGIQVPMRRIGSNRCLRTLRATRFASGGKAAGGLTGAHNEVPI